MRNPADRPFLRERLVSGFGKMMDLSAGTGQDAEHALPGPYSARPCDLCPELDAASQGDSTEQARDNLREALELFFETVSPEELDRRLHGEVYMTQVDVAVG